MTRMGRHRVKPRRCIRTAPRQLACFFLLCLPYYQSLLIAGATGVLSFLLLTLLLLFVVSRTPAIHRAVRSCLAALRLFARAPVLQRAPRRMRAAFRVTVGEPSLAPSFQRPPPLFS